jgi:membrane-bound ClpP family serine protease
MLDGYSLVLLLLAIGAVLIVAELLLPSHGMLGIGATAAILGAVYVCSRQSIWAGLALLVALAIATPFVWTAFLKIWPKTPVGRRVILPPIEATHPPLAVRIGQSGVTVSELRPMGTCEFEGVRLEAISEHGLVAPGTAVKVVALVNNRPTVRVVA